MICNCDLGRMRGKACHCRTCCVTFSGPWAFDKHIVQGVHCRPDERNLVEIRPGVWGNAGHRPARQDGAF